jgi:hypothetical protein
MAKWVVPERRIMSTVMAAITNVLEIGWTMTFEVESNTFLRPKTAPKSNIGHLTDFT